MNESYDNSCADLGKRSKLYWLSTLGFIPNALCKESSLMLLRSSWFRLTVLLIVTSVIDIAIVFSGETDSIRVAFVSSLQAIMVIFTIIVAISVAYFMNYVRGIRAEYVAQVKSIQKLLWEIYEKFGYSSAEVGIQVH